MASIRADSVTCVSFPAEMGPTFDMVASYLSLFFVAGAHHGLTAHHAPPETCEVHCACSRKCPLVPQYSLDMSPPTTSTRPPFSHAALVGCLFVSLSSDLFVKVNKPLDQRLFRRHAIGGRSLDGGYDAVHRLGQASGQPEGVLPDEQPCQVP